MKRPFVPLGVSSGSLDGLLSVHEVQPTHSALMFQLCPAGGELLHDGGG